MEKQLHIERLSHDGRGISYINGKIAFVSHALPGEEVLGKLHKTHKNFDEYHVQSIATPSEERATPPCPHFQQCGGCQLQHLQATQQRKHKEAAAIDQIQRSAGLKPATVQAAIAGSDRAYRARARLATWYQPDSQSYKIGFRAANSKTIIPIADCYILHPELNRLLPLLSPLCEALQLGKNLGHIDLILHENSQDEFQAALSIRVLKPLTAQQQAVLSAFGEQNHCLLNIDDGGKSQSPPLRYHLPEQDIQLQFAWQDFTQANRLLNRAMVSSAIQLLQLNSEDRVLDAFCGMGNFSLGIAQQAEHVIAIEGSQEMVERGQQNADHNQVHNIEFLQRNLMDTDNTKRIGKMKFNKALIDPPRDGARELCEMLCKHKVERLVYISCNPAKLARDANILAAGNYALETLYINDMFPHSHHSEVTACFTFKSKKQ